MGENTIWQWSPKNNINPIKKQNEKNQRIALLLYYRIWNIMA